MKGIRFAGLVVAGLALLFFLCGTGCKKAIPKGLPDAEFRNVLNQYALGAYELGARDGIQGANKVSVAVNLNDPNNMQYRVPQLVNLPSGAELLKAALGRKRDPDLDILAESMVFAADKLAKDRNELRSYMENKEYLKDNKVWLQQQDAMMQREIGGVLGVLGQFQRTLDAQIDNADKAEMDKQKAEGRLSEYDVKLAMQQARVLNAALDTDGKSKAGGAAEGLEQALNTLRAQVQQDKGVGKAVPEYVRGVDAALSSLLLEYEKSDEKQGAGVSDGFFKAYCELLQLRIHRQI